MQKLKEALQEYWGYDTFRSLQREAMESVLNHRDSVVVLPTGGGKSLCFQAPAVAMPGMALVVSPLIALMKDQVDGLTECGVPAAAIHSALSAEERHDIDTDIRSGRLKLLYVAPERLVQERFIHYLKKVEISFIAIDEAHCISMWGHDFRPEFRGLSQLKEHFPGVGVHSYTATATPQVRDDIAQQLCLDKPEILVGSFDRPNLTYRIQRRTDRLTQICAVIDAYPKESGIIYCIRRADVDELCAELRDRGHRARPYHAGMADLLRKQNQEAFINEGEDIIVATIAFGMGIDKSNVRYVIHAGMPKSLEHYQQESGRAGRDNLEAECHLLFSGSDFFLWKNIMGPGGGEGADVALEKLNQLYDFCTSLSCRHHAISSYFGQRLTSETCGACDVCLGEVDIMDGGREIARQILEAMVATGERFGAVHVAKVLAGSRDARVQQFQHNRVAGYGALSSHGQDAARDWVEQLVQQGFIERVSVGGGDMHVLQLSESGRALYDGEERDGIVRLSKPAMKTMKRKKSKADTASWDGVERDLFERLRELRRDLANEKNIPPYQVFGDAALRDMARLRPVNKAAFLKVRGVGQHKASQYGKLFMQTIRTYCEETSTETNVGMETESEYVAPAKPSRRDMKNKALELFNEGLSLAEILEQVPRAETTLQKYLCEYLRTNASTDPQPWITEEELRRVREAVEEIGLGQRLKAYFDHLKEEVPYRAIEATLICMENAAQGKK
jgi:ATP-dependent DNA helicase RecQ